MSRQAIALVNEAVVIRTRALDAFVVAEGEGTRQFPAITGVTVLAGVHPFVVGGGLVAISDFIASSEGHGIAVLVGSCTAEPGLAREALEESPVQSIMGAQLGRDDPVHFQLARRGHPQVDLAIVDSPGGIRGSRATKEVI